jgi:hypothetical protein
VEVALPPPSSRDTQAWLPAVSGDSRGEDAGKEGLEVAGLEASGAA